MTEHDYPGALGMRDHVTPPDNSENPYVDILGGLFRLGSLVVIGQTFPRTADPFYCLYPYPLGSTGSRLFTLARDAVAVASPSGVFPVTETRPAVPTPRILLPRHWLALTQRYCLCPGDWHEDTARRGAEMIREAIGSRPVLLLGRRVSDVWFMGHVARFMGHAARLPAPLYVRWDGAYVIPHPAGRNRAWSEPGTYSAARIAIARAIADAALWSRTSWETAA